MKSHFVLLGLILSLTVSAQFPEPRNFAFAYSYLMIGQSDVCGPEINGPGNLIYGPAYCTHFEWNTPDTTSTSAHLESYKIYYQSRQNETTILATTTDTSYYMSIGIMGTVWVTAVYSNPAGESLISNIQQNDDLPIAIKELNLSADGITYDRGNQTIILNNIDKPQGIKIIDATGKVIEKMNDSKFVSVNTLIPGLYFVEYKDENSKVLRFKFIR